MPVWWQPETGIVPPRRYHSSGVALMILPRRCTCPTILCVVLADRITASAQVFESSEEALRTEERIKDQLCQELNLLVQQSAHAQIEKLEQLTQRLEYLNQVNSQPPC